MIKGGRKCFADKGRAFKTDVIETVFAFCEVGGEKSSAWWSHGRVTAEKRERVNSWKEPSTEPAQLGASFCLNLCLPRSGVNESFGLQNDFIGSWIIKCPLHPVASKQVV